MGVVLERIVILMLRDIRGKKAVVGDAVTFIKNIWDSGTILQIASVVNQGKDYVEVSYIDTSYLYNSVTKKHDIEVEEKQIEKITEFVKL